MISRDGAGMTADFAAVWTWRWDLGGLREKQCDMEIFSDLNAWSGQKWQLCDGKKVILLIVVNLHLFFPSQNITLCLFICGT